MKAAGLGCLSVSCFTEVKLSVRVKLFVSLLCTCIAWKGRPRNDL